MNKEVITKGSLQENLSGMLRSCGLLSAALIAFYPVVGTFAYVKHGLDGVLAAGVATLVCFFAAICAEIAIGFFSGPMLVMYRVLFGMILRMGIPLGVCLAVHHLGGALADAGFVYYLLAVYLISLFVETILTLRSTVQDPQAVKDR